MNITKYLKKKIQLEYQKLLVWLLIKKSIRKCLITCEENGSQEFRLKNIDETRIFLTEEIIQKEVIISTYLF